MISILSGLAMMVGRQFRTPHAAFRNQRLPGTCKGLGNGGAMKPGV